VVPVAKDGLAEFPNSLGEVLSFALGEAERRPFETAGWSGRRVRAPLTAFRGLLVFGDKSAGGRRIKGGEFAVIVFLRSREPPDAKLAEARPVNATRQSRPNPRYEQEVAGADLDGAGRQEDQIGEGVPDAAEPQLVARILLAKERDDFGHFAVVFLCKVYPAEHRRHKRSPTRSLNPKDCVQLMKFTVHLHPQRTAAERREGHKPAGEDDYLLVLAGPAERVEHQVDAVVVAIDESIIEDDRHITASLRKNRPHGQTHKNRDLLLRAAYEAELAASRRCLQSVAAR
jgi:hypothetical protein